MIMNKTPKDRTQKRDTFRKIVFAGSLAVMPLVSCGGGRFGTLEQTGGNAGQTGSGGAIGGSAGETGIGGALGGRAGETGVGGSLGGTTSGGNAGQTGSGGTIGGSAGQGIGGESMGGTGTGGASGGGNAGQTGTGGSTGGTSGNAGSSGTSGTSGTSGFGGAAGMAGEGGAAGNVGCQTITPGYYSVLSEINSPDNEIPGLILTYKNYDAENVYLDIECGGETVTSGLAIPKNREIVQVTLPSEQTMAIECVASSETIVRFNINIE